MSKQFRFLLLAGFAGGLLLAACAEDTATPDPASSASVAKGPAIRRVFLIVLGNQDFASSFGPDSRTP